MPMCAPLREKSTVVRRPGRCARDPLPLDAIWNALPREAHRGHELDRARVAAVGIDRVNAADYTVEGNPRARKVRSGRSGSSSSKS